MENITKTRMNFVVSKQENSFQNLPRYGCWLIVWVLWHINLCKSVNAKFCLYIHTYSTKDIKTKIMVGKIFYLQDFICLHKINQF